MRRHIIKNEGSEAIPPNQNARYQAGTPREPLPNMVNRRHIYKVLTTVCQYVKNGEQSKTVSGSESGDQEGTEGDRLAEKDHEPGVPVLGQVGAERHDAGA